MQKSANNFQIKDMEKNSLKVSDMKKCKFFMLNLESRIFTGGLDDSMLYLYLCSVSCCDVRYSPAGFFPD